MTIVCSKKSVLLRSALPPIGSCSGPAQVSLMRASLCLGSCVPGRESRAFPDLLRAAILSTSGRLQKVLEHNLRDELGLNDTPGSHFSHYQRLLADLEIPPNAFERFVPGPALAEALSIARSVVCSGDPSYVYGYILVNESATPPIYSAVHEAARRLYPTLQSEFFQLHIEGDAVHVQDLISVRDDVQDGDAVLEGVAVGERGMSLVLDEADAGHRAAAALEELLR